MLVISDPSAVGLKAAGRIRALCKELAIKTRKNLLIVNRCDVECPPQKVADLDLTYIGHIPVDAEVAALSLNGSSLFELKKDSLSISELRKLGAHVWQS